jgi:hypothetical protein
MSEIAGATAEDWETRLAAILPLFGHRNWIVVADAAYPAQSKTGIETIVTGGGQIEVLRKVKQSIEASRHIRANIYVDEELAFVSGRDAHGVDEYKQELKALLAETEIRSLKHEYIIGKLDQSAQVFRILILKTSMFIPYTSVFFELECGYWDHESEQQLRSAMLKA